MDVEVLRQALPYLNRFQGSSFVVKLGGRIVDDASVRDAFCEEAALLLRVGIKVAVVHGAGPQMTEMSRKMGFEPVMIEGRRVTGEGDLEVAKMVLSGKVNVELLSSMRRAGAAPVGLSGVDGRLVRAKRRPPRPVTGDEGRVKLVDYGLVGEIQEVNADVIRTLWQGGFVPVIASLGADDGGVVYNINADTFAAHVAKALHAQKMILASDTEGYLDEEGKTVSKLERAEVRGKMAAGKVHGGMAPKLEAALLALDGGVASVHLINGTRRNALLAEIFTDEGSGTMVA